MRLIFLIQHRYLIKFLPLVCVYLLTSLSAKVRFYGFVVGTIGFVPGIYLLIEAELWWLLAAMPLWVFINYKGLVNNWREFKGEETTT